MNNHMFTNMAKGVAVGASMLIPGISGGTMAIILGIYDKLLVAVSTFFRAKRKNTLFLGSFALGGLMGIIIFAKPLLYITTAFKMPMMYFFMGAVIGSIPILYRKANIKKFHLGLIAYPLVGFLIVYILSKIPSINFSFDLALTAFDYVVLLFVGLIAAVALVLPGISVSYVLLFLGMYDATIKAIDSLYLPFLIPLGISILIGICLSARVLEKALHKYTSITYLMILGFVTSSVLEIFPGVPKSIDLLICPFLFLFGANLIYKVSTMGLQGE